MPLIGSPSEWSLDTKHGRIAAVLAITPQVDRHIRGTRRDRRSTCPACRATIDSMLPQVGVLDPFVFCDRNGRPKPMRAQMGVFANLVRETHEHIVSEAGGLVTESSGSVVSGSAAASFTETSEPFASETPAEQASAWEPIEEEEEEIEEAETHSSIIVSSEADQIRHLYAEHKRIRAEIARRATETSDPIDDLALRPLKDGVAMIRNGISVTACLHAMAIDWDPAVRAQLGIVDFDPETEHPGGISAYLDALVAARVYIMLVGEAGTGKSFWAKDMADRLFDGRFGSLPCAEGATPSWILGAQRIPGYFGTRFLDIWENGGVFLLDEFDAMDANFGIMLNDGLANGYIDNPISGNRHMRHADCVIVAAGNTWGDGASRKFIRNEIDPATRDRFRMGRVVMSYSDAIARKICGIDPADRSI